MVGALVSMMYGIRIIKNIGKGMLDIVRGKGPIDKAVEIAGYGYDEEQDIFYSIMNPWQRNMGYNRLYDEASAPFGMIVDCEPIYFEYNDKIWLIELWKGQYDLNTGCEVGIYTAKRPILNIPAVYKYMFYDCASDEERLTMSFVLKKKNSNSETGYETLFTRDDRHWWLAGFKLGMYSEPSELIMEVNITFKDEFMCNAFVKALKDIGYSEEKGEFHTRGINVSLTFDRPYTPQPLTRTEETDRLIQKKNKILCDKYNEITRVYDNFTDKITAIQEQAPEIYSEIMDKATLRRYLRNMKNPENIID